MFKKGDKVEVLVGNCNTIPKGSVKEIELVFDDNDIRLIDSDGISLCFKSHEVRLVTDKPDHYKTTSIDVIDFVKLYDLNFNLGNVVKYVCRNKGTDKEDYKKAIDYLQRELKHLESLDN